MSTRPAISAIVAIAALLAASGSRAAERPLTLGVRINALHASGDLHGAGLALGVQLSNGWFAVANLDRYRFAPAALWMPASIRARPQLQSLVAGAAIGRRLQSRFESVDWFWSTGIATGLPQDVQRRDAVAIHSGTQVHLTAAIGGIRQVNPHWSLSAALRVERHYVDIRFTDRPSGEQQRLSTLTPAGLYLSLDYRF